jgi:hypothetical protein
MPKKQDTTKNLQTKKWAFMSVRLPFDIKNALKEDARKHYRPVGLHASFIISKYLKEK